MSRSIDLFIDCDRPIDEVAAEIEKLTGIGLRPGEIPGTLALEEGGVSAELRTHPYVDDGELVFESYRYALSARVPMTARSLDTSAATLLRMVSESLQKGGIPTLLVHDLQFRDRPPAGAGTSAAAIRTAGDESDRDGEGGGCGDGDGGGGDRHDGTTGGDIADRAS